MKGPADKSAASQTYYGLLRFSRMFLAVAGIDHSQRLHALAQSNIDLAQQLLDLTPMLFRVLEPGAAPATPAAAQHLLEEWDAWKRDLCSVTEFARFGKEPVHDKARRFLARAMLVRWGDLAAMTIRPFPGPREVVL
jgi:hypothetical protein